MPREHGGRRDNRKRRPTDARGGARIGAGRPKTHEQLRLLVADAELLRSVVGNDLDDALRRIAGAAAADPAGTRAALAPLLAIPAWDGKEIL